MVDYQILLCEDFHIEDGILLGDFPQLLGDFNNDGKIDENDINYGNKVYSEPEKYSEKDLFLADFNQDGIVDEYDNHYLNEYSWFPQPDFIYAKDNRITTDDVKELQRYLNDPSYSLETSIADVNLDGNIDELDVRLLLKIASGQKAPHYKTILSEKVVCELGSSTSNFSGKAIKPSFYTKIDGTHELSFSLPSHYLDEETGEMISNELVKYISNKSKIRLIKNPGDNQEVFHLVVNSKIDKDDDGALSYEYICTDTFIEELSKTGYSLSFGEEVGQGGLGTIHELALEVLENTGWKYMKEKTGTLYEYSTEFEYNPEQGRYDTVYIPKPVHPVKFIPELKRYCNILSKKHENGDISRNIYCYEDTEQIVTATEKNLIYNNKDFIDLAGWDNFCREKKDGKYVYSEGLTVIPYLKEGEEDDGIDQEDKYFMKISTPDSNKTEVYLLNSTAAASNTSITAYQPYLLKIDKTSKGNGQIKSIEIYDKNPLLNQTIDPIYSQTATDFADGDYHTIVVDKDISSPFIVFKVKLGDVDSGKKRMYITQFSLFKALGKSTIDQNEKVITAEENNLILATNLTNKKILDKNDKVYLPLISLPLELLENKESAVKAYTLAKARYFIRDNYKTEYEEDVKINSSSEDTVTYLPISSILKLYENLTVESINTLPEEGDTSKIYHLSSDDKYYQYYSIDGRHGEWALAFFGDGKNDKIRTLKAEKTNRFNLLQEISELFKAWCVFNIQDNGDGTFERQVWFKEKAINENFSGFHKGINLKSLERKSESSEVVTKIFVEDVENEFTEDGFVTIRRAKTNPWGENYYYNFKYYVDQHLCALDENGEPYIDNDLKELYREVGLRNNEILELNEKTTNSSGKLAELLRNIKALTYQVAAADARIASINGELEKKKINKESKKQLKSDLKSEKARRKTYSNQLEQIQENYNDLNKDYIEWKENLEKLQKEKISFISSFERKYSQYIKEGIWSDSSYTDANSYYYDSQKVSNTSAMPATSWTIGVLDGSVIEDLEDYKFSVGDMTFLVDNEFFGIENNPEENYVFEVLISGIKEFFDEPEKNEIELRNYLTSFEDLFQRITAATQTLDLKEQIYDKAAHFNNKGEIDTDILQKTLSDNALVLANASDNSYTLDDSGLTFQSLINPIRKTRLLAEGMFISNSLNAGGEPEWKTGITADGINASVLTAGEINTAKIKIYANGQPNQIWDALGITSYQLRNVQETQDDGTVEVVTEADTNRFVRFDNFGFYFVNEENDDLNWNFDTEGNAWFETKSREQAIQQIYDNADLSITEKGYRLNLSDNQTIVSGDLTYTINTEAVRLGYLGEAEIGNFKYDAYGLYIEGQTSSNIIVDGVDYLQSSTSIRFSTDGNNYIGNWKIEKDWIHNDDSSIATVSLETDSLTFTGKSDTTGYGSAHYGTNNLTINPKEGAKNMHNISLSTSTGLTIKYNNNDIIKTNDDTFWIKNLEIDENFYLRTGNITLLYTDYSNNDVPYLGLNGALRTAIRPSGAESTEYVMKNGVWEVGNELCHGIICYKKYSSGRTKDMGIAIYDGEGSYDAKLYFIYNGNSKLIASFPK